MTVLQQIRDYYNQIVPANQDAKKITERLITPNGVKSHPTPETYFAERTRRLDDLVQTKGRLLSQDV